MNLSHVFDGRLLRPRPIFALAGLACIVMVAPATAADPGPKTPRPNTTLAGDVATRVYDNTLTRLANPKPLLADHPEFVEPVHETVRYEAPLLVDDKDADLNVRAWRFSYNARGIIEMPNRLKASTTALIMVHPWGVDDGQGWRTPEP